MIRCNGRNRSQSIGLIRTGAMHYFEAGMEVLDASARMLTGKIALPFRNDPRYLYRPGFDNLIYDMHGRNSNGYLKIR